MVVASADVSKSMELTGGETVPVKEIQLDVISGKRRCKVLLVKTKIQIQKEPIESSEPSIGDKGGD